jgi:hypothetical protein
MTKTGRAENIFTIVGLTGFAFGICWFAWLAFIQPVVGTKPIHKAAKMGNLSEVQKLVEQGTPVDLEGPNYWTPLQIALSNGHIQVARYLLDKGASGKGTLAAAIAAGEIEVLKTVVTRGAKVYPDTLAVAISNRSISGKALEIARYLLNSGADINAPVSDELRYEGESSLKGYTSLHNAVYRRDLALVEYLVSQGADLNVRTPDGDTPLTLAESPYRVYSGDPHGPGIHYYRVVHQSPEIAAFLRSKGAK